jgi:predicted nucleotidyltransferase
MQPVELNDLGIESLEDYRGREMGEPKIDLLDKKISEFIRHNHLLKRAVFWSYLRGNKTGYHSIDILVKFNPDNIPGMIRLAKMENELSSILGCNVDMRTPKDLSRYFRQEVLKVV